MLKVVHLKGVKPTANMFGPTASWGRCDIFACEGGAEEERGQGGGGRSAGCPWRNMSRTKSPTPSQ